jgi:hypothetical protein
MEVCSSVQGLEEFALGHGIWKNLVVSSRIAQLKLMLTLLDELYPTLRWFLFDGLQRYSAPLTIFGPKRAAIYVGNMYVVFNSTEHIRALTRHFDDLIRASMVQPRDVYDFIGRLAKDLETAPAAATARASSA